MHPCRPLSPLQQRVAPLLTFLLPRVQSTRDYLTSQEDLFADYEPQQPAPIQQGPVGHWMGGCRCGHDELPHLPSNWGAPGQERAAESGTACSGTTLEVSSGGHAAICVNHSCSNTAAPVGQAGACATRTQNSDGSNAASNTTPSPSPLAQLDRSLLWRVLSSSSLSSFDLWRCCQAGSRALREAALELLRPRQFVCFHTRLPATQALLGMGVAREWDSKHPWWESLRGYSESEQIQNGPQKPRRVPQGPLSRLSTHGDLVSLEAFQAGVRDPAFGHEVPFDAFLPLYLYPAHGQQALTVLPACVAAILDPASTGVRQPAAMAAPQQPAGPSISQPPPPQHADARALLQVTLRVCWSGWQPTPKEAGPEDTPPPHPLPQRHPTRHPSDAAMSTFCHLHHLLLAAALQPGSRLAETAEADVKSFLAGREGRTKSACPNLAVLLVKLLLVPKSSVSWADFAPKFIQELLARQVRP